MPLGFCGNFASLSIGILPLKNVCTTSPEKAVQERPASSKIVPFQTQRNKNAVLHNTFL